jgi:hypothetical protein
VDSLDHHLPEAKKLPMCGTYGIEQVLQVSHRLQLARKCSLGFVKAVLYILPA